MAAILQTMSFQDLVANDVRGKITSLEEKQELHSDLDRWYDSLVSLKQSLEFQLAGQKAEMIKTRKDCLDKKQDAKYQEALCAHHNKRTAILRLRKACDDRLRDVRALLREQDRVEDDAVWAAKMLFESTKTFLAAFRSGISAQDLTLVADEVDRLLNNTALLEVIR